MNVEMTQIEMDLPSAEKQTQRLPYHEWMALRKIKALELKDKYGLAFIGSDKQKYWIINILASFCKAAGYKSITDSNFFKVNLKTLLPSAIIDERTLLEQGIIPDAWIGSLGPHKSQLKKGMKQLSKAQRDGTVKIRRTRNVKPKAEKQPSMLDHFGIKMPTVVVV